MVKHRSTVKKSSKADTRGNMLVNLKSFMLAFNIPNKVLASEVGLSQHHISNLVNLKKGASITTAKKIAKYFGVDLQELTGEDSMCLNIQQVKILNDIKDLDTKHLEALVYLVKLFKEDIQAKDEKPQ